MNPTPVQAVPIRRTGPPPNSNQQTPATPFQLADALYPLFRHKWKILICFVTGLVAAGVAWNFLNRKFSSEAQLLVRYVVEGDSGGSLDKGDQLRSPDRFGESIISSEMLLLSSLDLALEVAKSVRATNLIDGPVEGDADLAAAAVVAKGLTIDLVPKSTVISVVFTHKDPMVAVNVVNTLVSKYQRLHARVHRPIASVDEWATQTEKQRSAVAATESDLRRLKGDDLVGTLADSQLALSGQIGKLESALSEAQATLAENQAIYEGLMNHDDSMAISLGGTNANSTIYVATNGVAVTTNTPLVTAIRTNAPGTQPAVSEISPEARRAFRGLTNRLEALRFKEQELLLQYNPMSSYVRTYSEQIATTEKQLDALIKVTPELTNAILATPGGPNQPVPDFRLARIKVGAASGRVKVLSDELNKAKARAARLAEKQGEIVALERKLKADIEKYEHFSATVEKAQVEEALKATTLANIAVIQAASAPYHALKKTLKIVAGLGVGGLAVGLGWAFGLEFFGDTSVRRPIQVTGQMRLPLFLSIPRLAALGDKAKSAKKKTKKKAKQQATTADPANGSETAVAAVATAEPPVSPLTTYSEALRDRLIMYFQARDVTHMPKLIGVTSFGRGAGVTSVATSLAATLSETGEGNVLYVDVNPEQGPSAHPFRQGRPISGVEAALTEGSRESAQVGTNLYAVSLSDLSAGRVGVLPRMLATLVPKIKASNYDYIIFDLPPVTQTSITNRVAGLLDVNVVVLESEKTSLGFAQQAVGLLAESQAKVVAVLNKHRRYIPRKLDSDL